MGCRGGELSGNDVDILTTNEAICEHLQKHWTYYTDWADRAVRFGVDNQGAAVPSADVIRFIENAVNATAASTHLNQTVRRSRLSPHEVVYLIARTVYRSPKECSNAVKGLINTCRGG